MTIVPLNDNLEYKDTIFICHFLNSFFYAYDNFTNRQAKVIFLHLSVSHSVHSGRPGRLFVQNVGGGTGVYT